MAKGVFTHRPNSVYDDFPEARYQFPKRYLNRARAFEGDWIVYYEPRRGGGITYRIFRTFDFAGGSFQTERTKDGRERRQADGGGDPH